MPNTEVVVCPYCKKPSQFVTGKEVYPQRTDLHGKKFWRCVPCDAYVGCHPSNPKFGQDGTRPLGRLADKKLRKAKMDAHAVFDPLWVDGAMASRSDAYKWLADALGVPYRKCHIGYFDLAMCQRVISVCSSKLGRCDHAPD